MKIVFLLHFFTLIFPVLANRPPVIIIDRVIGGDSLNGIGSKQASFVKLKGHFEPGENFKVPYTSASVEQTELIIFYKKKLYTFQKSRSFTILQSYRSQHPEAACDSIGKEDYLAIADINEFSALIRPVDIVAGTVTFSFSPNQSDGSNEVIICFIGFQIILTN